MREKREIVQEENQFGRSFQCTESLRSLRLDPLAKRMQARRAAVTAFSSFQVECDLLYAAVSPEPFVPIQGRIMDEPRQPIGHAALEGEHWPGFFPLRLILQTSGTLLELTRPDMVMGRHSGADVRLPLPDVSRRHCRCLFIDGTWHILDLNSMNGLYVNDAPVQQAVLHQGDQLRIGGFTFTVDLSARQADPMTEIETDDSPRHAILKALPPPHDAMERRRAS
jgi:FHA domain-containing protein